MIHQSKGIDSLANFKRRTPSFIKRLQKTGRPMVLTINGKAGLVVQDAKSYQELLELVDQLDAIEKIKRSMESFERGEGIPARKALEELRRKHKIPRIA
jgi:PHD/YefM family antitoxin component YafN of YafNO toxin-antitoxin module